MQKSSNISVWKDLKYAPDDPSKPNEFEILKQSAQLIFTFS